MESCIVQKSCKCSIKQQSREQPENIDKTPLRLSLGVGEVFLDNYASGFVQEMAKLG